jgi:16S rRNA (guanine966-N2)-methyltransferase
MVACGFAIFLRVATISLMRIIAGRLRHRKLLTNPGLTTRPIIDRAKQMLFDHIRDRLPGARVGDFFCGAGTLGFEALSRGAKSVVFAERDHRAHELLIRNAETLGVADQALCWRVDIARSSMKPKGSGDWTPYDVVFFDPPYAAVRELSPGGDLRRCLERLQRPDLTSDNVVLVVRGPREEEIPLPDGWDVAKTLEVASMRIVLAGKVAAQTPSG